MSERKQFISSFNWNTATVVFQIIIQMLYTGLLARMVSTDAFALMGIVLAMMGFAEIFSQVGIGPAIIQRKELHPQHLSGAFYTSLILGLVFTLIFVLGAPAIAAFYKDERLTLITQVTATSFTISALAVVPRSLMLKAMNFKAFFFAGMISIIGGNLIIGLSLAYLGYGVWAYVWALFAQNILMTLSFWLLQKTQFPLNWQWSYTKELISYGGASTLFNALNYAATKVDVTLLPKYSNRLPDISSARQGMEAAGMYERSAYVMSLPITIMAKLSDSVLFSGMSKMQDQNEKLKKLILTASQVLSIIIIPSTIYIIFTAGAIIQIYLGKNYADSADILSILFLAIIFRSLSRLNDALLRAKNAVMKGAYYKLFYLIIMIVGVYLAIPFGMKIVAASIVITTFIHYLMSVYLCRKLIKVSILKQLKATMPGLKLGLLTFCIMLAYKIFGPELKPLFELLTTGALWIISTLGLLYFSPKVLFVNGIHPFDFIPSRLHTVPLLGALLRRWPQKET
ncbi:MAG: lipopolysaccharide biosynthesis protein [Flavobacteriales bacterium]